jgi:hypothetical protein
MSAQHAFLDLAKAYDWAAMDGTLRKSHPGGLVDAQPAGRWSALHQAAYCGDLQAVKMLLGHGASPLVRNEDGRTARDLAEDPRVRGVLEEAYDKLHGTAAAPAPAPAPATPSLAKAKAQQSREKEAGLAEACPTFRACRQFAVSFGLPKGTFDASSNICFCSKHDCATRHPDKASRGSRPYGYPKGWCGLGLLIDAGEFKRRGIFSDWDVAFHGTKKDTAMAVLKSEWQLLMPGEVTASGYELPIRDGHITAPFDRPNDFTGEREEFDPVQVFTSPSIHYCAYEDFYCDRTRFEGRQYQVAFQVRQEPGTYGIGQETVGAEGAGVTIDPLFPNSELEYYTKRKGVHKLYRLLVREL